MPARWSLEDEFTPAVMRQEMPDDLAGQRRLPNAPHAEQRDGALTAALPLLVDESPQGSDGVLPTDERAPGRGQRPRRPGVRGPPRPGALARQDEQHVWAGHPELPPPHGRCRQIGDGGDRHHGQGRLSLRPVVGADDSHRLLTLVRIGGERN